MYNDSLSLAQAYKTLGHLSPFSFLISHSFERLFHLSPAYVHSCYHYGRLLRAKDDPVAAMQVFINATNAGSDDKQILGRIYSNMGSICHLAGEYSLAYDMYEKSTNCFLLQQDSLLYYYGLNNMAYESAEKGDKETMQMLLSRIEQNGCDTFLMTKTLETKARMYYVIKQYDSVLHVVDSLHTLGYVRPTGYGTIGTVIVAQITALSVIRCAVYMTWIMTLPHSLCGMHRAGCRTSIVHAVVICAITGGMKRTN